MNTYNLLALFVFALCIVNVCAQQRDIIIVGGGTAGCILAESLTRNPAVNVLVLDRGYDDSNFLRQTTGFYDSIYAGGFAPWVDHVKSHDPGRQIEYANPFVLGGASSVNGNYFQWPEAANLADWNSGLWTFNATLNARKALETYSGFGDPSVHGFHGPINVTDFPPAELDQLIKFTMAQVHGIGFDFDLSDEEALGVGSAPRNIDVDANGNGLREDSYTQILKPILNRPNLVLLSNAEVLKVNLKQNGKNSVTYVYQNEVRTVTAKKDVIIAAGVMETPKLLLLSGIGPADELSALGIKVQLNQSSVGKDFYYKSLTSQVHANFIPTNFSKGHITTAYYNYVDARNITNKLEHSVFCLPSSQIPGASACLTSLSQAGLTSRGQVRLFTNNKNVNARFEFNLFSQPGESEALVDLFKKSRTIFQALGSIEIAPSFAAVPMTATDLQITQYLSQVTNIEHAVGTCQMHRVVDERLRLIDNNGVVIPGIRLADTSVYPVGTTTHSAAATAYLVGARGAELIKEDYNW